LTRIEKSSNISLKMVYHLKKRGLEEKLNYLGMIAKFEACGCPSLIKGDERNYFIYPAIGEKGRVCRLFKVLQTNICENDCLYCVNRAKSNCARYKLLPTQLASIFYDYYRKGLVDGLFLSSGVEKSPDESQLQIIETARILRKKFGYQGYLHLKIMPGVNKDLIKESARYADRLSLNLEVPKEKYLAKISENKNFYQDLLKGLYQIVEVHHERPLKAGVTTQFVVGAAGENDSEILQLTLHLYKNYHLTRVYYSRFVPVVNSPLATVPPCPPEREFRLYQADILLRQYKFQLSEIPFEKGCLPLNMDPKLAYARRHPELFPLEVNRAALEELLRVPGIGPTAVKKIIKARKENRLHSPDDLRKIGINPARSVGYLLFSGKRFPQKGHTEKTKEEQIFLWQEL